MKKLQLILLFFFSITSLITQMSPLVSSYLQMKTPCLFAIKTDIIDLLKDKNDNPTYHNSELLWLKDETKESILYG
jgi:hypothetical protein